MNALEKILNRQQMPSHQPPPIEEAKLDALKNPSPCTVCGCPLFWLSTNWNLYCEKCSPPRVAAMVRRHLVLTDWGFEDKQPTLIQVETAKLSLVAPVARTQSDIGLDEWFDSLPDPNAYIAAQRAPLSKAEAKVLREAFLARKL